jgi:MSHA biogenesis protein MshL
VTVLPGAAGSVPTSSTSVQMQSYQSGVTLDIQPHISKGDQLQLKITLSRIDAIRQLDYNIEVSGDVLKGPTPPNLINTDVTTIVTVPDNMTIILGGLEKLDQSKKGSKVPFLGDVPIVGGLFKNTDNSDIQARLYVFLKAHIIRPGEQNTGESKMRMVSLKNRAEFEKHEKEMQDAQDWAGIKPKPMDPNTVLEEY